MIDNLVERVDMLEWRKLAISSILLLILELCSKIVTANQFININEEYPICQLIIDIYNGNLSKSSINSNTFLMQYFDKETESYILYGINAEDEHVQLKICMPTPNFCDDGKYIYAMEKNGICKALDPSGNIIWQKSIGEPVVCKILIDNSNIYAVTLSNSLVILDASNGEIIRRVSSSNFVGNMEFPPSIYKGLVYLATSEGIVYEISDSNVKELFKTPNYLILSPLMLDGYLIVATNNSIIKIGMISGYKEECNIKSNSIKKMRTAGGKFSANHGR